MDDAQWLVRPTNDVLAFLARRLESDPIVLLIAVRDGSGIENATLKIYPRAPHGLTDTHKQQLDDDLLAFLKVDVAAPPL